MSWQSIEVIRDGLLRMRYESWGDTLDSDGLRRLCTALLERARLSNSTRTKNSAARLAIAGADLLRLYSETAVEILRLALFLLSGARKSSVELEIELSEALSGALAQDGQVDLAWDAARSALEISRSSLGQSDPRSLSLRFLVARLARSTGASAEAEKLLRESLELSLRLVPELDPASIEVRLELARVLAQREQFAEAKAQYSAVVELSARAFGPKHPVTQAREVEFAQVGKGLGGAYLSHRGRAPSDTTSAWEAGL
jgi:tetratricopeptide (TPR) repeat protein